MIFRKREKKSKSDRKQEFCLNCGAKISKANFCPECGQKNTDKKLTLFQFVRHFLDEYLTFDSKFIKSLSPLILRPGHLSKEYVKGRRQDYILPLRLYIFVTFVFFFMVALNSRLFDSVIDDKLDTNDNVAIDSLVTVIGSNTQLDSLSLNKLQNQIDTSFMVEVIEQQNNSRMKFQYNDEELDSSESTVGKYLNRKAKYLESLGDKGSDIFIKEAINQIPKVLFVFLPVFALGLKLVYIRKKILYVEHLIFSIHIHTFLFLFLTITIFFPYWYIFLLVMIGTVIYLFLSIRRFYEQPAIKSLVKMFILIGFYFLSMIPALVLLLLLTLVSI